MTINNEDVSDQHNKVIKPAIDIIRSVGIGPVDAFVTTGTILIAMAKIIGQEMGIPTNQVMKTIYEEAEIRLQELQLDKGPF